MAHNNNIGAFGEKIAADYLLRHGYQIISQNLRIGHKEIDILAKINDKLVVIEVKTRIGHANNIYDEVLTQRKINKLIAGTMAYFYRRNFDLPEMSFDLVLIELDRQTKNAKIKHFFGII